jgi:hypothetical protein
MCPRPRQEGRVLTPPAHQPTAIVVTTRRVVVELKGAGRLVPWLGPAFRGITALRYRVRECRQPRETWSTIWRYCKGCPEMPSCGYGRTFEPDAALGGGSGDAGRPLILAPQFPVSTRTRVGDRLLLEITAIGQTAQAALPGVLEAVAAAGRHDGLGPDGVRFTITPDDDPPDTTCLDARSLPKQAASEPVVRDVRIDLTAPLFIRERAPAGGRRQIEAPSLGHLLRASMRVAREFFGESALCSGRGHLDLDDLAAAIEPTVTAVAPFAQEKASHRSGKRFAMHGVTGHWHFAALPACLVPWLTCGGILGVGAHRIAGAGRWNLAFGDAAVPAAGGRP